MNAVLEKPAAPPLSVTLSLTPEIQASLQEGESALIAVQSYEIADADTANAVAGEMNGYKRAIVRLEDLRKGFLRPAQEIIDNAKALFNPAIDGFKAAEAHCKTLLAGWTDKEQKRVALENLQREEVARKLRQEAEAKAAAELARANEEAAEKRRKAEAEAAAGNPAKAAKLQEQARAAEENGAARAQEAHLQAAAATTAMPVAQAGKIAGAQMRDKWIAKLLPGHTTFDAKAKIVEAIGKGRTELLGVLDLNESAIRKMAEGLHEAMNVPGYQAVNEPIVAGSKK